MKKIIFLLSLVVGIVYAADKTKVKNVEVPSVEVQMERANKIESYRSKKDVAWHKTEYNKVLKYLNKTKK
ncbi:MAG: hypothetical protein KBF12_03935 [Sebaldella sp.]|mgnify:FL=1|nr:hypothetical protein [Sebaldella sp.]